MDNLYTVENIYALKQPITLPVNILSVSIFHWNENLFYIGVMRCCQFPTAVDKTMDLCPDGVARAKLML